MGGCIAAPEPTGDPAPEEDTAYVWDTFTPGEAPIKQPEQGQLSEGEVSEVFYGEDLTPTAPPPANCSPMDVKICAGDPIATPAPADPGEPALTIRDVASFRPTPPPFAMEPDGWAVVGLPTNFTTEAGQELRTGILLGRAVEVRFTPVGYRWQFSDGVTLSSTSGGASWAELGAREFTDTETTRRFDTPGHVSATLIVTYGAEYRFAGSVWRTIAGTLDATGQTRDILVGEFDTVLTDGDCNARPTGPGC